MFELPELINLSKQINDTLVGKKITRGELGNSPHKFVWYNLDHADFAKLIRGKTVKPSYVKGRWLFIPMDPGYILVLGEFGGKLTYSSDHEKPEKYHLWIEFENSTSMSLVIQMWGAIELYQKGKELERQYIKDMRPDPLHKGFTERYFLTLIESLITEGKRSVKGFITQDQILPGLGNSIAQEIMFIARLHPKRELKDLKKNERIRLFETINHTIKNAIQLGGRQDEVDFFNHPGQYKRLMNSRVVGKPCSVCGAPIQKMQYLGGSCVYCPICQKL
ncbi:MAG: DNA-formamidopyrimidine glycosylase family protein [Candidatus Methylomirabilota bacterium]